MGDDGASRSPGCKSPVRQFGPFDHDCPSADLRYPNVVGRVRADRIRKDYVFAENLTVQFFSKMPGRVGIPNLQRHAINDRHQTVTVRKYCDIIKAIGIRKGARNEVVVVPSDVIPREAIRKYQETGEPMDFQGEVLGGAHLLEGALLAHQEAPTNEQVRCSIDSGIPNITVLVPNTPPDILRWFMHEGNSLNHIRSKTSFLQCYKAIAQIEDAWKAHLKADRPVDSCAVDPTDASLDDAVQDAPCNDAAGDTQDNGDNDLDMLEATETPDRDGARRTKNRETEYMSFIRRQFPGFFSKFEQFRNARAFKHDMEARGLWAAYEGYLVERCVFTDVAIDSGRVFTANKELVTQLKDPKYNAFLFEMLKMVVPTTDGVPALLMEATALKRLRCLNSLTLDGSKLVKTHCSNTNATDALTGEALGRATPAAKKRKTTGKAKAKAKALAKAQDAHEVVDKDTTYADDCYNFVNTVLGNIPKDSLDTAAIAEAFRMLAAFLIKGFLVVESGKAGDGKHGDSVTLTQYTKVRKHVKGLLRKAHEHVEVDHNDGDAMPDDEDDAMSADCHFREILEAAGLPDCTYATNILKALADDQTLLDRAQKFTQDCSTVDWGKMSITKRSNKLFSRAVQSVWENSDAAGGEITAKFGEGCQAEDALALVLEAIGVDLWKAVDGPVINLAYNYQSMVSGVDDVAKVGPLIEGLRRFHEGFYQLSQLWTSERVARNVLKLRPTLLLTMLDELNDARKEQAVSKANDGVYAVAFLAIAEAKAFLKSGFDAVVAMDATFESPEAWNDGWARIFKAAAKMSNGGVFGLKKKTETEWVQIERYERSKLKASSITDLRKRLGSYPLDVLKAHGVEDAQEVGGLKKDGAIDILAKITMGNQRANAVAKEAAFDKALGDLVQAITVSDAPAVGCEGGDAVSGAASPVGLAFAQPGSYIAFPNPGQTMDAKDWKAMEAGAQASVRVFAARKADGDAHVDALFLKVPANPNKMNKPSCRLWSTFKEMGLRLYLDGKITVHPPNSAVKGFQVGTMSMPGGDGNQDWPAHAAPAPGMALPFSSCAVPAWLVRVLKPGSDELPTMVAAETSFIDEGGLKVSRFVLTPNSDAFELEAAESDDRYVVDGTTMHELTRKPLPGESTKRPRPTEAPAEEADAADAADDVHACDEEAAGSDIRELKALSKHLFK